MLKISIVASLLCTLVLSFNIAYSQNADCTPDASVTDPEGVGVRSPIDLPVGFIGDYYNTVLTIISPEKAETWGFLDITITKIQLTEMVNMPEGLSWDTNTGNADDYMYAGDKYCLVVEGIPSGTPGIREIDVYANAWIRVIWESEAPGNPRNGGSVSYTLCNSLNLDLGNNLDITTDDEILISADQETDFHTYLWQDNSTNPTFLVRGSDLGVGNHKIKVTVTDTVGITGIYSDREPRCFKSDSIMVRVTQGNNAVKPVKRNLFSVSPNPAKDKISVKIEKFENDMCLELFDQFGKVIYSTIFMSDNQEIDVSKMPKGIYFISVSGKNDSPDRQKLVIQ
jgi:hypothetical protein